MRFPFWILAGSLALIAGTPHSAVTGPVLGSLVDSDSGRLRSLTGIPASAVLNDPASDGPALTMAVPIPGQTSLIGVEAETGAAMLVTLTERIELAGVRSGAARVVLSPLGRSAAFYFADTEAVQLVAGLPDAAQVVREVPLGKPVTALAVSDDARNLLAAVRDGDATLLILDRAEQGYQLVGEVPRAVSLEFFPASAQALYAGEAAVWSVVNGELIPLIQEGLRDIVAVSGSSDRSTIFVAMRSGKIAVRNLTTGAEGEAACGCRPEGLSRLRGNSIFRLNNPGNGPVWILDAGAGEPRVLFVAAPSRGEP